MHTSHYEADPKWGHLGVCTQQSSLKGPSPTETIIRSRVLFAWFCLGHNLHSLDGLSGSGVSSWGNSGVARANP